LQTTPTFLQIDLSHGFFFFLSRTEKYINEKKNKEKISFLQNLISALFTFCKIFISALSLSALQSCATFSSPFLEILFFIFIFIFSRH